MPNKPSVMFNHLIEFFRYNILHDAWYDNKIKLNYSKT